MEVEKESLPATWATEKFADFLVGKHFLVETDHKPLVSLLGVISLPKFSRNVNKCYFIVLQ